MNPAGRARWSAGLLARSGAAPAVDPNEPEHSSAPRLALG
jgi:hypothetical protein